MDLDFFKEHEPSLIDSSGANEDCQVHLIAGGKCCCNCAHQLPLSKHPWNTSEFAKGRVTEYFGFVCIGPDLLPFATFFDSPHGFCEMYSRGKK